jgi:hypothetical protein
MALVGIRKPKTKPGTDAYLRALVSARRSVNASHNFGTLKPSAGIVAGRWGITRADAQDIIDSIYGRRRSQAQSEARGDGSTLAQEDGTRESREERQARLYRANAGFYAGGLLPLPGRVLGVGNIMSYFMDP